MSNDPFGDRRHTQGRRGNDTLVFEMLDALKGTVNTLEQTVRVLKQSVGTLQQSTDILSDAFFGHTDPSDPMKKVPGLRDIVARHEQLLKFGSRGLIAALLFLVAHSAGVPTTQIWQTVTRAFGWAP